MKRIAVNIVLLGIAAYFTIAFLQRRQDQGLWVFPDAPVSGDIDFDLAGEWHLTRVDGHEKGGVPSAVLHLVKVTDRLWQDREQNQELAIVRYRPPMPHPVLRWSGPNIKRWLAVEVKGFGLLFLRDRDGPVYMAVKRD